MSRRHVYINRKHWAVISSNFGVSYGWRIMNVGGHGRWHAFALMFGKRQTVVYLGSER